jgi:cellulose synthase operon protein C
VAGGLASKGIPLKVAMGNEAEREAALQAVRENAQKGCVLDLLAFWTAARLQALDTIAATCGRIHLTQSVMDARGARRSTNRQKTGCGGCATTPASSPFRSWLPKWPQSGVTT